MITKQEYCLSILENLIQPGGDSKLLTNTSRDPLRNQISLEILEGKEYTHTGKIRARISGLALDSAEAVFEDNCFSYGCYQSNGIWTTAIKTSVERVHQGKTQYWVQGDVDKSGSIYIADVGYIYKPTGEPVIKEANISIYANGNITSTERVPTGVKFIRVKRVSANSVTTILHSFGEYQIPDTLLRREFGSALGYNAIDQGSDLEDISFTLISLLSSRFHRLKHNQYLYRTKTYVEPSINKIIESNLSRLTRLLDLNTISPRYGSLPRYPATYSEPEDIYGEEADLRYANKNVRCFQPDCFSEECFETTTNTLLISREVSTAAMGWFLLTLCIYELNNRDSQYSQFIPIVAKYIINQLDKDSLLPTDGWAHNDVYTDLAKINKRSTSTAAICAIALVKAFELTNDKTYLDASADIYSSTITILRRYEDNLFAESYENPQPNLESLMYGLLLSTHFNRADTAQAILNHLYSSTQSNYGSQESLAVIDSELEIVVTSDLRVINAVPSPNRLSQNPHLLSFFYTNHNLSISQVMKFNTLLIHTIDKAYAAGFSVNFYDILTSQAAILDEVETKDKTLATAVRAGVGLLNKNFFEADYFKLNNSLDIHTVLFYRSFLYEQMRKMWPLNFSWVSNSALSPRGNLGRMLMAVSRSLATLPTMKNIVERNIYIASATDKDLDLWGDDLYTPRFKWETDTQYRSRLTKRVARPASTKSAIINTLTEIDVKVDVHEVWKRILRTHSKEAMPGDDVWGRALFSGNEYATNNLIELQTNQPFNEEAITTLKSSLAAGILPVIRESLSFAINQPEKQSNLIDFFVNEDLLIPTATISPSTNFVDLRKALAEGKPWIDLNVELSWPYNNVLYVKYSTKEGTALADREFVPASGVVLVFPAGQTLQRIRIQLQPEGFNCYLLDEEGNLLLHPDGSALLLNEDDCYELEIQNPPIALPEGESPATVIDITTEEEFYLLTEAGNKIVSEDLPL